MDGINFQGMSRMPLTATEEAMIPRPPSSASQVATALPSTYSRFGSSHSLASAPSFHSLNRLPLNLPTRQTHLYSSPASSAPTSPQGGEQEYPQNPQDSYYSSPAVSLRRGSHSQDTPLHQAHQDSWGSRMESPTPMTESDDSDDEDDGEISRETDSSKERPSKPHNHRQHDHHHPRRSADLLRRLKQSTGLTFGGVEEGSHPGSGFPANNNSIHNQYISSHHPHPHRPQYHRSLDLHFQQQSQNSPSGSRRTSREYSDEERPFPIAPLHHPEPRRSRSAWRPSLSLIRQESSIHGQYPSINGQYPQHDTRPLDRTSAINQLPIPEEPPNRHRTKSKTVFKKDKKKPTKVKKVDKKPKLRPVDIPDDQSRSVLTMPNLQQVLEKKTSFPLGYDDFEAFLRTQRAAEYLNFWADVTAHEQLCRTFDVSERRQMRELQLEERAIARDKRRVALQQHADAHHSSDQTDHGQDLNHSNLYLTSRSSLQLPLTDHLSFPAENRRYGLHDSTSAYAPPTRRQTFDHYSSGAYNRLLAGVENSIHGRRSSMDRARTSVDRHVSTTPFSSQHHFGPPSASTPTSYNQMMRKRGSTDILAGTKPSTGESRAVDLQRSTSQQHTSSESHPNTLDEIAKLAQAVEESIQLSLANSDPGEPPHSVLEPTLFREPSTTLDQGVGPLQAPLAIRRSVDGPKPTIIAQQELKTLLVQSYRTIGLEDVQESALRIYRKFLIQLRTASMAAEEAGSSSKRASSAPGLPRGSVDGVAQRWDGYAEQVIAEWNEKWRDCGPEARRLRRLSGRTGVSERGDGDHHEDVRDEKHQEFGSKESGSEQGLSEELMAREEAMAKRRSGTGFTAFLNRLLRTETTILELPTLTINTTTVEEEAIASEESEDSGDEEEDYDSDIDDDDDDDDDEEVVGIIARKDFGAPLKKDSETELQAVAIETTTRPKEVETVGGSTAADSRRSSTSVFRSLRDHTSEPELEHEETKPQLVTAGPIRKSSLKNRDQTQGIRSKTGKVTPVASKVAKTGPLATMLKQGRRTSVSSMDTLNPLGSPKVEQHSFLASLKAGGSAVLTKLDKMESGHEPDLEKGMVGMGNDSCPLQRLSSASLPSPSHPTFPNSPTSSSPTPSSSAPLPHSSLPAPGDTVGSSAGTTFYLPLECRQRIHTQVLEEGRTEAPHLFGPAKGFVVEIVLRDHYYPLFLEHVQQHNLGLSSRHVSILRKRVMLGIGIVLWVLVVAAQVAFVLMGLGGWASSWVWVVGMLGGWFGSVCLATGVLGFSPILGLVGQIAEDRRVWRFRKIVDRPIRTLHFRRSVWMLTYCAFWSSVVIVIFAALPARK